MNEVFERQFCSGCLGRQLTTKIGLTDKKCCSSTLIPFLPIFLQCKLLISITSVQRAKNILSKCRLIPPITCENQTKNTNTSSFFTK